MAMVYNCSDEVVAAAFIAGLQADHSFCKHLVKQDITNMRDIQSQAQKHVQLEETMCNSMTQPPKQESEGKKIKLQSAPPKKAQNRKQNGFKK